MQPYKENDLRSCGEWETIVPIDDAHQLERNDHPSLPIQTQKFELQMTSTTQPAATG
jgi:hypothetical protein